MQALFLLVILGLFPPWLPGPVNHGLDPSYAFAINQALLEGLHFGTDIIFTFGPYGGLHTQTVLPGLDARLLAVGTALAGVFFALNFRLCAGRPWALQLLWWFSLAALLSSRDAIFFAYLILLTVFLHRQMQTSAESPPPRSDEVLLLGGFFMLGLFPLIKVSLYAGSVGLLILAVVQLLRLQQPRKAGLLLVTFVAGLVFFWLLAQQPLLNLPLYLSRILPLMTGFSDAMSLSGKWQEIVLFVFAIVLLLWPLLLTDKQSTGFEAARFLGLALAMFLFLIAKGAFVRHDAHALLAGQGVLVVMLVLLLVRPVKVMPVALVMTLLCWFLIDSHHRQSSTASMYAQWKSATTEMVQGIKARKDNPNWVQQRHEAALASIRSRAPLPQVVGSSDIYSWDQAALIASGNRWQPRPVFQSYSVYQPVLAQANRVFLGSQRAPEHLFLRVEAIDQRLPSLADGVSWPHILQNYAVQSALPQYLHLQKTPLASAPPQPQTFTTGDLQLGQWHELQAHQKLLWAQMDVSLSWAGKLFSLLYKPEPLRIQLRLNNGQEHDYRLVAGMANSGFLLSPLVKSNEDFKGLYSDALFREASQIRAFRVLAPAAPWQWRSQYGVAISDLTIPPELRVDGFADLQRELPDEAFTLMPQKHCAGSIDLINGARRSKERMPVRGLLSVSGWFAHSTQSGDLPDEVVLVLKQADKAPRYFSTQRTERPGLARHFKVAAMSRAAFAGAFDVRAFSGPAVLQAALRDGEQITPCQQRVSLRFDH